MVNFLIERFMLISFPDLEMDPLDVPEKNLLGIFSPSILKIEETEEEIIERGFTQPIGSALLPQIVKGCKNVLIVVADHTRTTPVQKIIPRLFKEVGGGGVKTRGVKILIA